MSYSRPTLPQLITQATGFFQSYLPGADGTLRRSVLNVFARMMAGLVNGLYGYLDWISRQSNPYTATGSYLELWANLKGVFRLAATAANNGAVTFSGNAGVQIPSGTQITRSDSVVLITTALATIGGGGTIAAPVAAQSAGSGGNTPVNAPVTLSTSIAGVQAAALVTTALTNGTDTETDAALRIRMLQRYQNPPQGGDKADYVSWALAVAGVTRAWCVPLWAGAGTVAVYFMMDVTETSHGGFPQGTDGVATGETRDTVATGDQLAVANALYPQRPVTALVYAKAPVNDAVNITINGISGVSATVKTQIQTALDNVFLTLSQLAGTIYVSDLEQAIASVTGTEGFVLTAPAANHTAAAGALPTRGTITYT